MKLGKTDLDKEVFIIAEVGNNHEGSYALAEELVGLAAEAGANAVKFQTFKTEQFTAPADPARIKRLKSFELPYSDFERLSKHAAKAGIVFFSTPLDVESAHFLNTIAPIFKIASGDNNFYPLIETIAGFGKPVILSSGMASISELQYSKGLIERVWREKQINAELAILHCVTSYPAPSDQLNLRDIPLLRERLQCTVGYSDHSLGIEAAVLSVALGARIIEKHFTINKNHSDFRDHQLSADPADLRQLVHRVREASSMLGAGKRELRECEKAFTTSARRAIGAKRDLAPGAVLRMEDLVWLRPATGFLPGHEHEVLGRKLKSAVKAGHHIEPSALE